jgi:cell division protein DivIC
MLLVLVAAAIVVAATGVFPFRQILAQRESVDVAETKLDALRQENMRLEQQIQALQTPQEVERMAREQFGLVRPGETSYVAVVPEGVEPEATESVAAELPDERPWWDRVWNFLTGGDLVEDG